MSSHKEVTVADDHRKSKKKPDTSDEDDEVDDDATSGTSDGDDGHSGGTSAVDNDDSGDEDDDDGEGDTLEDDALYQILKSFFTTSDGVGLADVISGAQLYDNLKGIRSELHAMNKHIHGILQKLSFINHSKSK